MTIQLKFLEKNNYSKSTVFVQSTILYSDIICDRFIITFFRSIYDLM